MGRRTPARTCVDHGPVDVAHRGPRRLAKARSPRWTLARAVPADRSVSSEWSQLLAVTSRRSCVLRRSFVLIGDGLWRQSPQPWGGRADAGTLADAAQGPVRGSDLTALYHPQPGRSLDPPRRSIDPETTDINAVASAS
jgi:hypothetical protein